VRALAAAALVVLACSSPRGDGPRDHPSVDPPARQTAAAPFSIEYRRITRHPTCRGNQRIKVDAHGAVFTAVNQADCAPGTAWSTPYPASPSTQLPPAERDQLARLIRSSGAMDLPALSTDPTKAAMDGFRDELEIDLGGRHVVVAVEQTEVAGFSQVRQALVDLAAR
jgi:hypothetical protein